MHRQHSSAANDVRFTASNVHVRPDIGRLHVQKLAIDARGLKLEIHSSDAPLKYIGRRAHVNTPAKYMHLNLGFPNGIPKGARRVGVRVRVRVRVKVRVRLGFPNGIPKGARRSRSSSSNSNSSSSSSISPNLDLTLTLTPTPTPTLTLTRCERGRVCGDGGDRPDVAAHSRCAQGFRCQMGTGAL